MVCMEIFDLSQKSLKSIINGLNNKPDFYESSIGFEYSSFEESLKSYCDSYCMVYINNNRSKEFFSSLTSIVECIVDCDCDMYYENFFRPVELITYYFGKIISIDAGLKDEIYQWLYDFCREFEEDMIVEEYFEPFINGGNIFHADEYYTDYGDFNKMISVFK